MGAPTDNGLLGVIIIGIVVVRDRDGKSGIFVAQVFLLQRSPIVFGVTCDKDLTTVLGGDGVYACFL